MSMGLCNDLQDTCLELRENEVDLYIRLVTDKTVELPEDVDE